jgi:hypothetical protein
MKGKIIGIRALILFLIQSKKFCKIAIIPANRLAGKASEPLFA